MPPRLALDAGRIEVQYQLAHPNSPLGGPGVAERGTSTHPHGLEGGTHLRPHHTLDGQVTKTIEILLTEAGEILTAYPIPL